MFKLKRILFQQPSPRPKRTAYACIFPSAKANEYDKDIGVLRSVVAGMGSSLATILCSHPFDVVRSRRQAKPKGGTPAQSQSQQPPHQQRKRDALRDIYVEDLRELVRIVREEGPLTLYRSVGVHLFGHIVSGVIYYAVEAFLKEALYHRLPPATNFLQRMGRRMLISTMAGTVQVTATHPLWVLKNREQLAGAATNSSSSSSSSSEKECGRKRARVVGLGRIFGDLYRLGREEGVAGLYAGIVPSLVLTAHTSLQYALYDELKMGIARVKGAPLSGLDRSLAGIASKTLALSVSNPVLMVRTRLMEKNSQYSGVADVVRRVWREEGPMAFYRGSSVGLYKILAAGISHPVYDSIAYRTKSFLRK